MPLTPAIRPAAHISSTAESPISAPPRSEAIGVKGVTVIVILRIERRSQNAGLVKTRREGQTLYCSLASRESSHDAGDAVPSLLHTGIELPLAQTLMLNEPLT